MSIKINALQNGAPAAVVQANEPCTCFFIIDDIRAPEDSNREYRLIATALVAKNAAARRSNEHSDPYNGNMPQLFPLASSSSSNSSVTLFA